MSAYLSGSSSGAVNVEIGLLSATHPTRTLNSAFVPSATSAKFVSYTVAVTGAPGSDGDIRLMVDGVERSLVGFHNDLTIIETVVGVVTLSGNLTSRAPITAFVLPGESVTITTRTNSGAPSFALLRSTEYLF